MSESAYREQVDAKRILQIREISRELPQACGDFLRSIAVTTGTFTRLAYAIDMRTFFHFLQTERVAFSDRPLTLWTDEDLARVSQSDLTAYVEYLTYYFKDDEESPDHPVKALVNHDLAIKRKLCSLRSFYDYLFKNGRIPANVTTLVPLPKMHEHAIIRLDVDEVARILDVAESGDALPRSYQKYHNITKKRDLAMLSLFLGTGIRISECVGLNIDDFDFEQNAFVITRKGGKEVILYLSDEVAGTLKDYLEERKKIEALPGHENAFFLSIQRRRITQRAVENMVKKYASIAAPLKKKISPHKLRSTFGTNLYRETGDIYLVADVLGHSDVNTTRKHYAAMAEDRRRIAAQKTVLRDDHHGDAPDGDA